MSRKHLPKEAREKVLARAAALCNEGWEIPEVLELLTAEGYRRADGTNLTDLDVYHYLFDWRARGLYLRGEVKNRKGQIMFLRTFTRKTARSQAVVIAKDEPEEPSSRTATQYALMATAIVVIVFCFWAMTQMPGVG